MSNSPLGNKYALAALREKRATLAGELEQLRKQITWKQTQLASVDDTLTLFDASYNPGSIRPKKPYQRIHLFKQGELTGAILKPLREAGKACSTEELVTAVLADTGASETARHGMTHRVRASLQYLWRERKTVAKHGSGRGVSWSLTEQDNLL
jgi:hypothetical protein